MSELLFDRERAALGALQRLIEERRRFEQELTTTFAQDEETALAEGGAARQALAADQERETADLEAAARKEMEALVLRHKVEEQNAQRMLADCRKALDTSEKEERARLDLTMRDALWMADSILEGGQKRIQEQVDAVQRAAAEIEERIESVWKQAEPLLIRFDLAREDLEPKIKSVKSQGDPGRDAETLVGRAEEVVESLRGQSILPWSSWAATIAIAVVALGVGCLPGIWLQPRLFWLLGGVLVGFTITLVSRTLLTSQARRRVEEMSRKAASLLSQARLLSGESVRQAEQKAKVQLIETRNKSAADRRQAEAAHAPRIEELTRRGRAERAALDQQAEAAARTRRVQAQQEVEAARKDQAEGRSQLRIRHDKEKNKADAGDADRLRQLAEARSDKEDELRERWEKGTAEILKVFSDLEEAGSHFADLGDAASQTADQVGTISAGVPFGAVTVNVLETAADLDEDKLAPLPLQPVQLSAFLPFPRVSGLMLHALGQGRSEAVRVQQALMLRFLTALPPGKVRFTIFDPVGLGDNFAAFMHLADHDEALVSSRIWTEPAHIEKQLADLTVHMENVIQKYLRSQFRSIEDYNARAGEVAEPYRILVVANFPVNFTPQAARRLVSIVQSGSSCGVYALIGFDTKQALPQSFQIEDLEQLCLNLYWRKERFEFQDPDLDCFPLRLETPPATERVVEIIRRVGAQSRDANRVQVPFSFIAPKPEEVWNGDSRKGVSVPLGRAGAVRFQALQLGQGTSQHVLVAGKTGSGKSTLWHALISNLALRYSPSEVELYLIDFKKGVEFKMYADQRLPHARVIAIESEREFGRSVLQRLDAELRARGDQFRAAGVNDLAGYRQTYPERRTPRILLIVDEFQEFFVEDDRVSQEAALLLDRLVRQGRAFGLHVLLGSQTLGGAYSLARSTIDQMAVRIALQCSEADAQLILDKDNSAARLLSRPGEAIYNDANGALEGNEVFQVVWLPEEQREEVLRTVRRRAEADAPDAAALLPLVFEGNSPAGLERNPLLARLLEEGPTEPSRDGFRAWLGDAIAIKDPTAAVFRAQTSHSLLIVGQNDEAALALLTSALVSLTAQDASARFVVLDGAGPHEPHFGYLKEIMDGWPGSMERIERSGVAAAVAALAEEMNQRLKGAGDVRSSRYLIINGLQRYREFRRSDDDLGFGRRGAERTISPLEHLQALLRDGPTVGVHVLIWCDSLVNVMRSLDRQGLRECGQRVLFQMSAADSSHLLDSPLASRLGRNRALYATDEMDQPEKFRPYGLPSKTWLAEVKKRLSERAATAAPAS
jgi:hypothetical protein